MIVKKLTKEEVIKHNEEVTRICDLIYEMIVLNFGRKIETAKLVSINTALMKVVIDIHRLVDEKSYDEAVEGIIEWLHATKSLVKRAKEHMNISESEESDITQIYLADKNKKPR